MAVETEVQLSPSGLDLLLPPACKRKDISLFIVLKTFVEAYLMMHIILNFGVSTISIHISRYDLEEKSSQCSGSIPLHLTK